MTNKKLKLAAMSVALTACVAAQPMAAHAVEGPDSVEDNAAPQAEPAPVEGKTAEGEVEGEEEKQEEFVPPENDEAKKDDQAPAFGPGTKTDDITIDYKPAEKPEEPGETDETENPDGTYVKGDVIDNSKKDEATGKDGKIGEATKEETPDSSSSTTVVDPDAEVKKGDPVVGKDEDGNTTITPPHRDHWHRDYDHHRHRQGRFLHHHHRHQEGRRDQPRRRAWKGRASGLENR